MAKKIIIPQNMELFPDQIERLKSLGEVVIYNNLAKSADEWFERCKDADIVCSGKFGLKEKIYDLPNTFFSLPYVGIGWIDREKIKKNNITVSYAPGCNKEAVSEWIIFMILNLLRNFSKYVNVTDLPENTLPDKDMGLTGKKVCILGFGNIGERVGKICEALDMRIEYFRRGDNLLETASDSDVVVNVLSQNPTTEKILDKAFFESLKKGSYFVSVTSDKIYDTEALLEALDKNILSGAAIDTGDVRIGDANDPYYKKLQENPKILATPHIAYNTDITVRVGNDVMIDNIESYLQGKPVNLMRDLIY